MATKLVTLKDVNENDILPRTRSDAVYRYKTNTDGTTSVENLNDWLSRIDNNLTSLMSSGTASDLYLPLTAGSTKALTGDLYVGTIKTLSSINYDGQAFSTGGDVTVGGTLTANTKILSNTAHLLQTGIRHIDSDPWYTGDKNLYIGWGAQNPTENTYLFYSTKNAEGTLVRTLMGTVCSTGLNISEYGYIDCQRVGNHGLLVGTIRGKAVGTQTGEFIHMYERVAIGSPAGWGSRGAPTYGLSTYGGAWLATDTGNVIVGSNDTTTYNYKFNILGNQKTDGHVYARDGFYGSNYRMYYSDAWHETLVNHTDNNVSLRAMNGLIFYTGATTAATTAHERMSIGTHNMYIHAKSGAPWWSSAIEVREVDWVTDAQSSWDYAPKIGFHWGGRYAGAIGLKANGNLYYCPLDGYDNTIDYGLRNIMASTGDIVAGTSPLQSGFIYLVYE